MKQIQIPPMLQNLNASVQMSTNRSQSKHAHTAVPQQLKRAKSEMRTGPSKLPKVNVTNMPQEVLDVGLATKLIPVEYYVHSYKDDDEFIQTVAHVDTVLDNVFDPQTEIINGSGFTQFWQDINTQKNLSWVECEILSKIDADKFLVFIHEQNFYKIVSNANIIFKDVVLQQENQQITENDAYENEREQKSLPVILNLQQQLSSLKKPNTKEYMIKIFKQQQHNSSLQKNFQNAIQLFGQQAIQITKRSFESIQNTAEFTVSTLMNKSKAVHNVNMQLDPNKLYKAIIKLNSQRMNFAHQIPIQMIEQAYNLLSGATILCSQSISSIKFEEIHKKLINFDFEKFKDVTCNDFIQHAQLTDSQLQVLQSAFQDEKHPLHWCCDFLALFLWSSFRLFKSVDIFDYCYKIKNFNNDSHFIIEQHRDRMKHNSINIKKYLQNIQNKQFHDLSEYIYTTFEDHKKDIMLGALHIFPQLWTAQAPKISKAVSNAFMENFASGSVEQLFINSQYTNQASFSQTFTEKLLNAHKLVYQIIGPHFVDQIVLDFGQTVMSTLNSKLHEYQNIHGKTPPLATRDQFAHESYVFAHQVFQHLFKIMEIRYFRLFVEELYETAVPEWFYLLLAFIHGGTKKKVVQEQKGVQNELLKIVHLIPNVQTFQLNLQKDVQSLNKYTDFQIPFSKQLAENTLFTLSQTEFKIIPEIIDNFISGIQIHPDPLKIAGSLEASIQELAIYYSSCPKLTNSLVYNYKTNTTKNYFTTEQREVSVDYKNTTYKQFLQVIYTDTMLTDQAYRNQFGLDFQNTANLKQTQKVVQEEQEKKKKELEQQQQDKFAFKKQVKKEQFKPESKYAEVIYYEPSVIMTKLIKLSKVAADKLTKYFEIFTRYFALHIQKTQVHIQHLYQKQNLLPKEMEKIEGFNELMQSIDHSQRLYKISTQEDQTKAKLKPISDFLQHHKLVTMITSGYQAGCAPSKIVQDIIDNQVNFVLNTLQNIYENSYGVQQLPNICYYSSCKINLQSLLQYLQQQDRFLFDLYSQRLHDYSLLIQNVLDKYLEDIDTKIQQSYFNTTQEIGQLYQIFKLFTYNKTKWQNVYEQLTKKVERYESMPFGDLAVGHYARLLLIYTTSMLKFKRVYLSLDKVISRVTSAYNQSAMFLVNVQNWLDQLVSDLYLRAREYLSVSSTDWESCEQQPVLFAHKFPFVCKNIVFPKLLRLDEQSQIVDLRQLSTEISNLSLMPIFKAQNIKVHIFDRPVVIKKIHLIDAFQELDEILNRTILTIEGIYQLQNQLLGQIETLVFDSIDKQIFTTLTKREAYVKQLTNQGDITPLTKTSIEAIINNFHVPNTTVLSRLKSLKQPIQLASKLVQICSNFEAQYQQWLKQQLSLLYSDDVRNQTIEAIRVSSAIIQNFPQSISIRTLAQNLMEFLVKTRNSIIQIFLLKASIYESSIQIQVEQSNIPLDRILKIDPMDMAIPSQLIKLVLQNYNAKIQDDTKTEALLLYTEQQQKQIFQHIKACQQRIRFEKLQYLQSQQMSKILASNQLLSDTFELPALEFKIGDKEMLNSDYIALGANATKMADRIKLLIVKNYQESDFYSQLSTLRSQIIQTTYRNELTLYIDQQFELVFQSLQLNAITPSHAQSINSQLSVLRQMYKLVFECYVIAQQYQLLVHLENRTKIQETIQFNFMQPADYEMFQLSVKQLRSAITTCFTTVSNAIQHSSKKLNKEKIWEMLHSFYKIRDSAYRINSPFYKNRQQIDKSLQLSYMLDLIHYEIMAAPKLQLKKGQSFPAGGIVLQLPDDINFTLSALLPLLGFQDCLFRVLYYIKVNEQSKQSTKFFVDGIMSTSGFYFKFAYPLIYDHIYEPFFAMSKDIIKEVIQITLHQHMIYWEARIDSFSVGLLKELIQYPPTIMYHILSHMVMKCYNELQSIQCISDDQINKQIYRLQQILNAIIELDDNQVEVDLDEVLQQIQLSMITSMENYQFYNEDSTLQPYPAFNSQQVGQEEADEINSVHQDDKKSDKLEEEEVSGVQDLIDEQFGEESETQKSSHISEDQAEIDIFDQEVNQQKSKRPCLHEGFHVQDFEYLSMVKANPRNTPEQIIILSYISKVIQQIVAGIKSKSPFSNFVLVYSEQSQEQLSYFLKKKISSLEDNKEIKLQGTLQINLFSNGQILRPYTINPKFQINSDQFLFEQTLQLFGSIISQILYKFEFQSQLFIITPKGEQIQQQVNCLLFDVLGSLVQTKIEQIFLNVNQFENIAKLFQENCILVLCGHQNLNQQQLIDLSNLLQQKRNLRIIHLLPSMLLTAHQNRSFIDNDGQNIISIINGSDENSNIIMLNQLQFACQAQALTMRLTQDFVLNAISQPILNLIVMSQAEQEVQVGSLGKQVLQRHKDVYKISDVINEMFDLQNTVEQNVSIINKTDDFLYKFFPILDEVRYGGGEKGIKYQNIPEQLTSWVKLDKEVVQHSILNDHGWKYMTDLLLLLFEQRIDKYGLIIENESEMYIREITYVIREIVSQQLNLGVINVKQLPDFQFNSANSLQIYPESLYIIEITKNSSQQLLDLIIEFLSLQKPINTFILVISDDPMIQNWCGYCSRLKHQILNNSIIVKNTFKSIETMKNKYDEQQLLQQKNLSPSEFNLVLSQFNVTQEDKQFSQSVTQYLKFIMESYFTFLMNLFQVQNIYQIQCILTTYLSILELHGIIEKSQIPNDIQRQLFTTQVNINQIFVDSLCFHNARTEVFAFVATILYSSCFTAFQLHYVNVDKSIHVNELSQNLNQFTMLLMMDLKSPIIMEMNQFFTMWQVSANDYMYSIQNKIEIVVETIKKGNQLFTDLNLSYLYIYNSQDIQQIYQKNQEHKLVYLNECFVNTSDYKMTYSTIPFIKQFELQEEQEEKPQSDVFLTENKDEKPSRIQHYLQLNQYKTNQNQQFNSKINNLGFLICNNAKQRQHLILKCDDNQFCEEIFGNAITRLQLQLQEYQTPKHAYKDRPQTELRVLQYLIDNEESIAQFIYDLRQYSEIIDEKAIFMPFTVVRLIIITDQQLIYNKISQILHNKIRFLSDVGLIGDFQLQNISFIIQCLSNSKIQSHNNLTLTIDEKYYKTSPNLLKQILTTLPSEYPNNPFDKGYSELLKSKINQRVQKLSSLPYYDQLQNQFQTITNNSNFDFIINQAIMIQNSQMYNQYIDNLAIHILKDVSRIEFIESKKETIEKYKFDPYINIDFSEKVLTEAQKYTQLLKMWGSNVLPVTVPTVLIEQSAISYDAFSLLLQHVNQSSVDMNLDVTKSEQIKTLFVDFGSLCGQYTMYNYQRNQLPSIQTQTDVHKIRTIFRQIISTCMRTQRHLPLNYKNQDAEYQILSDISNLNQHCQQNLINFTQTNSSLAQQINQHGVIINFDTYRNPQTSKGSFYQQYILLFPLSLLIQSNALQQVLTLTYPMNDRNPFINLQELQDFQAEACAYVGLELLPMALITLIMSTKVQIYIYQDCQFNAQIFSPYVQKFNIYNDFWNGSMYVYQQKLQKQYIQRQIEGFVAFEKKNEAAFEDIYDNKLSRISFQVYSILKSQVNSCDCQIFNRISQQIYQKIMLNIDPQIKQLIEVQSKIGYIIDLMVDCLNESDNFELNIVQEQELKQQIEQEIVNLNNEMNEQQNRIKDLTNQQSAIQTLNQQNELELQNQVIKMNNLIHLGITELENISKQEITELRQAEITDQHLIYMIQLLLHIFVGKTFDNCNYNYTNLPKPNSVGSIWDQVKEIITDFNTIRLIINFDLSNLSDDQNTRIKNIMGIQQYQQNQIYQQQKPKMLQKLLIFAKQLYSYVTYTKDDYISIKKQSYLKQISQLETDKQVFKDKYLAIKQQIQDTQKRIDQQTTKIYMMLSQSDVRNSVSQQCNEIKPFFENLKNDIIYDIFDQQKEQQLARITSVFISVYILYGFDTMNQIYKILVPIQTNCCPFCFEEDRCLICQNCQCLCNCLYDIDQKGAKKIIAQKAAAFQLNYYFSTKDTLQQTIYKTNLEQNVRRNAIDYFVKQSSLDFIEMQSALFCHENFRDSIISLSMKNYTKIIPIMYNTAAINALIIDCDIEDIPNIEQQLLQHCQKNVDVPIVLLMTDCSNELERVIQKITKLNYYISRNLSDTIQLAGELFRGLQNSAQIQIFVIFKQHQHQIHNCIQFNSTQKVESKEFEYIFTSSDKESITNIINSQKNQLQQVILSAINTRMNRDLCQFVGEYRGAQKQLDLNMSQLLIITKQIKKEIISTHLPLLHQAMIQYTKQIDTVNQIKQQMSQLMQQKQVDLKSEQVQYWVKAYMTVSCQLVKISNKYPEVLKLLNKNVFFDPDQNEAIDLSLKQEFNGISYSTIITNIHKTLSLSNTTQFISSLCVYLLIVILQQFNKIDENGFNFIKFCFQNVQKTKKAFIQALNDYKNEFTADLLKYSQQYAKEFDTIFTQPNLLQYVKDYYKKNLLPEQLQRLNCTSMVYLFAIQCLMNQKSFAEQSIDFIKYVFAPNIQGETHNKISILQKVVQSGKQFVVVSQDQKFALELIQTYVQSTVQLGNLEQLGTNSILVRIQDKDITESSLRVLMNPNIIVLNLDQFDLTNDQLKAFVNNKYDSIDPPQALSILYNSFQNALKVMHQSLLLIQPSNYFPVQLVNQRFKYFMKVNSNVTTEQLNQFYRDTYKLLECVTPTVSNLQKLQQNFNLLQYIKNFTELPYHVQQFFQFNSMFQPLSDGIFVTYAAYFERTKNHSFVPTHKFKQELLQNLLEKTDHLGFRELTFAPKVDFASPLNYNIIESIVPDSDLVQNLFRTLQNGEGVVAGSKQGQVAEIFGQKVHYEPGDEGAFRNVVQAKVGSQRIELKSVNPVLGLLE
ncbi:Conserved_hypothetical protein [Hexamita inflata]|uniref:Uncharacterized protein n=1 Tax=Hexamita inflata TaxID=28002 RepID=A0ABP1J9T4_9EUKA